MVPRFIIRESSASMPRSCRGRYVNIAVIETDGKTIPKIISERAKSCVKIHKVWRKQHLGSGGPKTQAVKAREEARAMLATLSGTESFSIVGDMVASILNGE